MKYTAFFFLLTSGLIHASVFEKLKEEVQRKSVSGNPAFVGDYANINADLTQANVFKLPRCAQKDCDFDFSTNIKMAGAELFTCSPLPNLKVTFANNDKGYLFIEVPSEDPKKPSQQCSLRLEMKTSDVLVVSQISCNMEKIGDCETKNIIGEFKRLGRPSFDCGVLTPYLELTPARRTICHNIELADLDRELDQMYEKVEEKDAFSKGETNFMREREACSTNEACLKTLYVKWRDQIKAWQATK